MSTTATETPPAPSRKARVLIVEDEPILAFTLEDYLNSAGFDVVAVEGRLPAALAAIESTALDVVILDANLAGVSAAPAAAALTARGVPFIVVSGYLPEQQLSAFSGGPRMQKPCRPDDLVRALHDLIPDHA
jgi:CheY-like chemotaxis protein